VNAIDDGLYDKLAGHAALTTLVSTRIYRDAAPEGATLPYVVFLHQAAGEENMTPARSLNPLYQVRGVSSVSADEAGDIADAIDGALHMQTLTVSGWTNYWTARTAFIRTVETNEGVRRWHRGAFYRIRLDQ